MIFSLLLTLNVCIKLVVKFKRSSSGLPVGRGISPPVNADRPLKKAIIRKHSQTPWLETQ